MFETYELYIHPWSFRKIKGCVFVNAFNNETRLSCVGYLTKYIDGEIIFRKLNGDVIKLREKRQQKEYDNINILT